MDFYALLGVKRTASAADVERAYRRLARRFHPGVNPGDPVAERKYQQVQEAYLVLGDAERRRDYDRGSDPAVEMAPPVAFEGFDFTATVDGPRAATFSELFADVFRHAAREATTPSRGLDVAVDVHLSFEDAVRGCQVPLSVTRRDRCGGCGGRGFVARDVMVCPACAGDGQRRWARGHMVFSTACDACGGNGQTVREVCGMCRGSGVTPRTDVVTIAVPPGLESGSRVAVPGRGHAGAFGGPTGDLYVTVEVGAHPYFTRRGADLHLALPVSIHEAAFGAVIKVPGLGGPVRLRIPAGAQSGDTLVVRGQGGVKPGTAERGDVVATIHIALPATLNARSRTLLREFGQINQDDVRQGLFEPS